MFLRRRVAWRLRLIAAWLDPDLAATRPEPGPLPRRVPGATLPSRLDAERARHPDLHVPLAATPWADPLGDIRSAFTPYDAEVIRLPATWAPCREHQLEST